MGLSHMVYTILVFNQPLRSTQPGHPFMGKSMSIGDDHSWCLGRSSDFCITVLGDVNRTAGKLTS